MTISKGGTHTASLIFSAGNWNVKGVLGALSGTAGAGSLNVNNGSVTLSGNNTGDGAININNGILSISSANNLGTGMGAVRLGQTTTSGTLLFTGSSNATITRLLRIGNGASANQGGSATIQNDGTGVLTFDNATFNEAGTSVTARSLTLRGTNTGNNTISGVIANNSGATLNLIKWDVGTWNLTGENTFSNGLQIWEGVLEFDGNGSLGAQTVQTRIGRISTSGTLRHTGAGNTTVSGQMQIGFGSGGTGNATIESSGVGTLSFGNATFNVAESGAGANRTLTLGGDNAGANTISGAIMNNNNTSSRVSIIKAGSGTWVFAGANTYTGNTTIIGGRLALGANHTLPDGSAVSLGAATLDITTFTDSAGSLDVTAAATINLGTGAALAFADSRANGWSGGTLNLTGTFVSGSSLKFGSNANGLTATQLGKITASGFSGFALNTSGYLTAAAGYAAWQYVNGTTGALDQDHDNDSVSNGVEYFLGGNTNTTGFTQLPGVTDTDGTRSVTWTKSVGYKGTYGTHFWVESSESLTGTWMNETEGGNVTISGNNVTYTFPNSLVTRKFARLVVTYP